jgi:hypothetical protein
MILVFTTQREAFASSNPAGEIVQPERVIPYAKHVEQELAARGARVAIVARVGRDPEDLPSGIEYTHVGFWVYSEMTLPNGEVVNGYVVHNLYQMADNPDRSELVSDFPAEFFGDVFELRAGVIIPEPALQQLLLELIGTKGYRDLHVPNYSLIANPRKREFQNCTNFVLNTVVGSVYQTADEREIQAYINAYYEPQKIGVSGFERLLGPLFVAGVATSDHENDIRTSTFGSLSRFMKMYDLTSDVFEIVEQ